MKTRHLRIHPRDNVEVALTNLSKGEEVLLQANNETIVLTENIPAKHKFTIHYLNEGDDVVMYGVLVGRAVTHIPKGGLITTQNIKHATGTYGLKERKTDWHKPDVSKWQNRTFRGYHRANGLVGTGNHW